MVFVRALIGRRNCVDEVQRMGLWSNDLLILV